MMSASRQQHPGGSPRPLDRITGHFKKYYQLWLLALPGIVLTLMFAYIPMSGLVIVFKDYNYKDGIFGSPWAGFKNFEFFFSNFSKAWRATQNTIILNLFYTVFGTAVAVMLAVMFNEIRHKKYLKVTQSLSIMPYFISWVVAGGILRALLNYDGGTINNLLVSLGMERVDFYNDPKYWRFILTLCNIWKGAGYNGIIYFSTIAGFDTSESAQVDGANLWKRIRYITIPLLKPTIIIMFLLSIGKIMSGDLTMMMSITNLSSMLLETTDIIDTYVYRSVIGMGDFVMGSAVGLYQSMFGFALGLFAVVCLYPLLLAVGTSFSDEVAVTVHGYRVIPKQFSLEAYRTILGSLGKNILNAYCVTIAVTVTGTLLSVIISASFAYVLNVRDFKPRGALNMFLYIPMIFSAGLLPWYIMCTKYYHLTDSFLALILPCCMNAFNVFLLRNFFKSIPEELAEAAKIDGASYLRIFRVIYFPLAKVGLVTVGLFYALSYWNDYYLALMFINRQQLYPLQYYLYNMLANVQFIASQANASLGYNINIPLETTKMATICVTIGPIILLYPFAQKYITKDVIVGAVKG